MYTSLSMSLLAAFGECSESIGLGIAIRTGQHILTLHPEAAEAGRIEDLAFQYHHRLPFNSPAAIPIVLWGRSRSKYLNFTAYCCKRHCRSDVTWSYLLFLHCGRFIKIARLPISEPRIDDS
jgi:hypothetical protein